MNVKALAKGALAFCKKNSDVILVAGGLVSLVGATLEAIRATPKATRIIDQEADKTPVNVLKKTWKLYIPTALLTVTGLTCVIGGVKMKSQKLAAMTAAYAISKTDNDTFRAKVKELFGEKKVKEVTDEIAKDKIEKAPAPYIDPALTVKSGPMRCLDSLTGNTFTSDRETLEAGMIEFNKRVMYGSQTYGSLNELRYLWSLPPIDIGDHIGWKLDQFPLKLEPSSALDSEGVPCLYVGYSSLPVSEYWHE